MLTTQAITKLDTGAVESRFKLEHSSAKTTLDLAFSIHAYPRPDTPSGLPEQRVKFTIDDLTLEGDTEAALDKLAEWLERAALALRERKAPDFTVPVY